VARFYIDNCLSPRIARELRQRQHWAVATRSRQMGRAGDEEQLLIATQNSEILVTSNRKDFFLLHDAWLRWSRAWSTVPLPQHPGILVIPQAWPPDVAAHELDHFVTRGVLLANGLYWFRLNVGWQQRS